MESKEFLEVYKNLDKYTKIGLVLAELPNKMQIQIIKSVINDKSLNNEDKKLFSSYLLHKSTLSRKEKEILYKYRDSIIPSRKKDLINDKDVISGDVYALVCEVNSKCKSYFGLNVDDLDFAIHLLDDLDIDYDIYTFMCEKK